MTELIEQLRRTLAERFRLECELGRGGMASVYLAEDLRHHRKVAVKVLTPEFAAALGAERFHREIEITAQLTHPHILPVHDSGEAGGMLYYVMPYVAGESLRGRLAREPQLPLEDVFQIAREIADALDYAHALRFVHRDVKPENILLEAGHAVLSDFGVARSFAAGAQLLTQSGMVIGTPAYMSPEQSGGEPFLDGRSDLYSLACVVYEMLVGEPPFTGPTPIAIFARKSADPVPNIRAVRPAVPRPVQQALVRALATHPADRFATASAFARALIEPEAPRASLGHRIASRLRGAH